MTIKKQANKLIIEVDLTPEDKAELSKSGKNKVAFSTHGFTYEQGLGLSINIIHK